MTSINKFNNCLLCNSVSIQPLQGYEKDYLVKCRDCGFVFCQRIPTSDELNTHYNKYVRGNSLSEITIKRYEELLEKFEPYRETNNIIDVGCGDGFFLQVAKQRGWNVYGTEFTDKAVEVCSAKGISMIKGPLNPANYSKDFFDIVTSFEVIEHINNPIDEILKFKTILRHGGIAYVTTPNFNSVSRDLLKGKWSIIEYPEHLSYYTASTLKKLFTGNGFEKVKVSVSGISVDRIRQGFRAGKSSSPASSGSDEGIRRKAESSSFYKFAIKTLNKFLDFTSKGDVLKGTFKKR